MRFVFVGWLREIAEVDERRGRIEQPHNSCSEIVAGLPHTLVHEIGTVGEGPGFILFTWFPFCDAPPLGNFLGVQDFKLFLFSFDLRIDPLVDRYIFFFGETRFAQFELARCAIGKFGSCFSGDWSQSRHERDATTKREETFSDFLPVLLRLVLGPPVLSFPSPTPHWNFEALELRPRLPDIGTNTVDYLAVGVL